MGWMGTAWHRSAVLLEPIHPFSVIYGLFMTKSFIQLCALCFAVCVALPLRAQSAGEATSQPRTSMCAHLASSGRVSIHQDARIEGLLQPAVNNAASAAATNSAKGDKGERITTSGYRIRIFSGNNQTASKKRATDISYEIKRKFPDLDVYVYFKTPNWRLTAGNFRTSEEAYAMMAVLKKEFPSWGREMFIVRDEIELPMD
jgi:hypothetical protein